VYGLQSTIEIKAMRRVFSVDTQQKIRVRLFVQGKPYKLLGLFPATMRLIGPVDETQPMYLLGADRLGRDMLSRLIYGTRVSMSIGLVGVLLSLVLGILLGGISGYYGGLVDSFIQRVIEFLRSIPTIPLWMGLAAALPMDWPPLRVYFGITIILSLIGWTGLARVVRGRFLSLREEEFIMAAEVDGASELRIILRYMLPSFTSHIIASTTLAIPSMILAETSLSFLGLGLRPPIISWGVLLKEAQSVRAVLQAPWLMWPAVAVVISVLALNFLGDGLRDAADPYVR
jgi:peptide/nickel transport system permease protein